VFNVEVSYLVNSCKKRSRKSKLLFGNIKFHQCECCYRKVQQMTKGSGCKKDCGFARNVKFYRHYFLETILLGL